jgi:hypothetical protein
LLAEAAKRGQSGRERIAAGREARAARPQTLLLPVEAYAGRYENPLYGTLVLGVDGGRLQAAMGAATCPVEVFDAAKHQLRVELFGSGEVVSAIVAEDGRSVPALQFRNLRFDRR